MGRVNTKKINIGNITIGGENKVLIQSMCNIKTSNINDVIKQINDCAFYGASLMRVSVLDFEDAKAIKEIVKNIKIPLVADIHFNYKLAIEAIKNGAKKIRINPGNLTNLDELKEIIKFAKEYKVAIRIGINSGSLNKKYVGNDEPEYLNLVNSALDYIKIFEENDFFDIVVSLKSSNPIETFKAYTYFDSISNYPLHIGVTESGFDEVGIIRSVSALSPLLLNGIGDTIRISLSGDPIKEVITCKRLLHDLGLYPNYPTIICCPTCGRCQVDVKPLAKKILDYMEQNNIYKTVAVMGCVVNGIGEGKNADIGLAGGNGFFILFKNGQEIKKVSQDEAFDELIKYL